MASPKVLWAGRILSGLAVLFLLFDGLIKLPPLEIVITTMNELGYPATDSFARFLGVVTLACTALYAWPRTALLGAVLLTGLFGGAIATHLRIGSPLFSHRDDAPDVLRLRVGTLDGDGAGVEVGFHIQTASKAAWWTIDDDRPQHPHAAD